MAHRYDYRRDYKGMTIIELREALKKIIDRMLESFREDVMDDCIKRSSYIQEKIRKYEAKHA